MGLGSILVSCNLVAHTGDYSVGSAAEDGSAGSTTGDKDVAVADGNDAATDASGDVMGTPMGDTGVVPDSGTPVCNVTVARGAIATPNGYQTVLGRGGLTYPFDDRAGSMSCIAQDALCAAGSTAVASAGDWGAAFGFSLDEAMTATSGNVYPVPSNAVGIAVDLSNFPQATRVAIDHGGVEYCASLSGAVANVKWANFNTECWNNQGTFLSGPPDDATYIHIIVPAIGVSRVFNFCVTSIAFALAPAGTDAGAQTPPTDSGSDGALDAASVEPE